jgi:hypothetical protein
MKLNKSMQLIGIISALCIISFLFGYTFGYLKQMKEVGTDRTKQTVTKTFYDGEGNAIPDSAVHLLVMSQFVKIDRAEQDYLNKYFYFNTLELDKKQTSFHSWLFSNHGIK